MRLVTQDGELPVGAAGEGFPDHWFFLRTGHFASWNPRPWRPQHCRGILGETGRRGCKQRGALTDAGTRSADSYAKAEPRLQRSGQLYTVSLIPRSCRGEEGR